MLFPHCFYYCGFVVSFEVRQHENKPLNKPFIAKDPEAVGMKSGVLMGEAEVTR